MDNRKQVQEEFARQAATFEDPGGNVSSPEILGWIVSHLGLRPQDLVLDVAAGTALLSRAVAPHVRSAVALDVTAAMLHKARSSSKQVCNLHFVQSDAEQLPFLDSHFDLAMTRLSFHHMTVPERALAEMLRVTTASGRVAVIDLVAPDAGGEHEAYDQVERLRDPSHTQTLSRKQFVAMLAAAGLVTARFDIRELEVDLEEWLAKAQTPAEPAARVRATLHADLNGGPPTGMRPFRRDGRLVLHQAWGIFVGRRP